MITHAVAKHCGVTQDRRPLASWIIVLTTLSRATSEYPVTRPELRGSINAGRLTRSYFLEPRSGDLNVVGHLCGFNLMRSA